VAENVMAGNAMSRRASYMYGNLLPADEKGQVGAGLGTTTSAGTVTLLSPTDTITKTGEKRVIDGLTYEFLMALARKLRPRCCGTSRKSARSPQPRIAHTRCTTRIRCVAPRSASRCPGRST
jgi:hypothetical protein